MGVPTSPSTAGVAKPTFGLVPVPMPVPIDVVKSALLAMAGICKAARECPKDSPPMDEDCFNVHLSSSVPRVMVVVVTELAANWTEGSEGDGCRVPTPDMEADDVSPLKLATVFFFHNCC